MEKPVNQPIIKKALNKDEAAKLEEVFKNAPAAAEFNSATVQQSKNADGSSTFTLNFRQTLKDRLLLELALLKADSRCSSSQRESLTAFHGYISGTVQEIRAERVKESIHLNVYPFPKVREADTEWTEKIKEILDEEPVKVLLRRLLPAEPLKRKRKKPDGIASTDSITISTAYIQQNFNTPKRRQAEQLLLPLTAAKADARQTGIELKKDFKSYGIELNYTQEVAVKALLQALTHTNYNGNTSKIEAADVLPKFADSAELPSAKLPAFKNIRSLPRVQITQQQYLELCGIDREKQSEKQNAIEALTFLGREQFVFWWQRVVMERVTIKNKRGVNIDRWKAAVNEDGSAKLEDVYTTGTLFYIKEIKDEKTDLLKYYEVSPSPVLLDSITEQAGQKRSFIYYPLKLERDIQQKTGKRLKKLEAKLMLWLTWKFEEQRQHRLTLKNYNNDAALAKLTDTPQLEEIDWKALAIELNVPESQLKKKQKTVYKRLQSAYEIAQKAGFIKDYKLEKDGTVQLYFNAEAYHLPHWQKEQLTP
jgi:hypothetical protein